MLQKSTGYLESKAGQRTLPLTAHHEFVISSLKKLLIYFPVSRMELV